LDERARLAAQFADLLVEQPVLLGARLVHRFDALVEILQRLAQGLDQTDDRLLARLLLRLRAFAIGVERVIDLMREAAGVPQRPLCDVYVLHQGGATFDAAMRAAEAMRDAGLDVLLHAGESSLKSQMKKADASGAEFAVIVGEAELAAGTAAVKALRMRDAAWPFAEQKAVALQSLGDALVEALESLSE